MPTILTSSNSGRTRRCDSSCHTAKRPECRCICGGKYHGLGTVVASEQLTKDWLGDKCSDIRTAIEAAGGSLKVTPTQLELQL